MLLLRWAMAWDAWVKGFLLGVSIAAPVGPIALLCIKRTLEGGWLAGWVTGLGAATADFCYGLIAALGLAAAASTLTGASRGLQIGGAAFLIYLGVRTFVSRPAAREASAKGGDLVRNYATALVLTLANPLTILSFAAMFAGVRSDGGWQLAGGVLLGSAVWHTALTAGAAALRGRLNHTAFLWVNRGSGLALVAFGVVAILDV